MPANFYESLPAQQEFQNICREELYTEVPVDWYVAIADVVNSTEAISKGQYKQINLLGASVIIALLNLDPQSDYPFVFGGDGAAVMIPPELHEQATSSLIATQQKARQKFDLALRVGLVPIRELKKRGYPVRVARFEVHEDYHQAMFMGGGLALAEKLLKTDSAAVDYSLNPDSSPHKDADYSGLECRWQNIPSPHGETITLLVRADGSKDTSDIYASVLKLIRGIFGETDDYRPLSSDTLNASFSLQELMLETELRNEANWFSRQAYLWKIWAQNGLLKYFAANKIETSDGTRWDKYYEKLVATSDFRKFDDMLRMVLTGTSRQRKEIEEQLEEAYQSGKLAYGMHISTSALITCVVFERMGRQIHFVDGNDGGYAEAARDLKRRVSELPHRKKQGS